MTDATRQLALPFDHHADPAADPFIPLAGNAEALAWLDRASDWPMHRLLLWGEAGSGKSHLAHRWARGHGAAVTPGVLLRWPMPDAWHAVDDAEAADPESLLHLLNWAAERRAPVLLTARRPPSQWATRLVDLTSRLRATTAARVGTDDSLLPVLLARLLSDRQLAMTEATRDWLLLRLPRAPGAVREAVCRLDRAAMESGGRVTRALAAMVVDEVTTLWHAKAS